MRPKSLSTLRKWGNCWWLQTGEQQGERGVCVCVCARVCVRGKNVGWERVVGGGAKPRERMHGGRETIEWRWGAESLVSYMLTCACWL